MNDDEWRKAVDEHLIREMVEDLQERVKELDFILRGERDKGGLIAEYERHDEKLTRLYAVIFQDPTGQKGLLHDVDYLMGRRSDRDKMREYRWHAWTAILIAILSTGATLLINLDKIQKILPAYHPGPLETKIEKAKHPRSPKKIFRYRIVPATSEAGSETEPETPQNP